MVTWHIAMVYLPVSLLYISSMTLGYIGLRYIELSISSPICNSSGALVAVLCFLTGTLDDAIEGNMRLAVIGAVALVCIGVIGLGIVESREDDELRRERQAASNYKYAKSWLRCFCRWRTVCSMRPVPSRTPWDARQARRRGGGGRNVRNGRGMLFLRCVRGKQRLRADIPVCGFLLHHLRRFH